MAKLDARDLDRRITLLRLTNILAPPFNEPVASWVTVTEVGAKVVDASARESYRAQEVGAEITARFTIRWSPAVADINPLDRVKLDAREYNITAVRNVGRAKWREIDAVARAES
jgi:SPP1 family predicted phage head-tail adaptor